MVEERVVIKLQSKKQRKAKEMRLMLKAEHGKANEVDLFGRQLFAVAAIAAVAEVVVVAVAVVGGSRSSSSRSKPPNPQ